LSRLGGFNAKLHLDGKIKWREKSFLDSRTTSRTGPFEDWEHSTSGTSRGPYPEIWSSSRCVRLTKNKNNKNKNTNRHFLVSKFQA
jgi:hypothetical protein